jgi:iron complex transport system ATP-binding protein
MITVEQVTKRYAEVTVVDGVSIRIPRGGVVSIIGPNGAGKSTLLRMVSRLLAMDGGSVHVDEIDVSRAGAELAKRLAILRQDNHVTARLTVRDLVAFGRFPHCGGRPSAADLEHVDRALGYLELADLGYRFLDELSGGQRQRVFLAMVLCQDTEYILLDEPLNNLDMRHSVQMMRLLRNAADELDKTVVMVLHDINFASCWSDRIIAMRDGSIAFDGDPDDLMQRDVLRRVYDMDIDVHDVAGRRIACYFSCETAATVAAITAPDHGSPLRSPA